MLDFSDVREIRGWFSERTPESDVVLSCRARLARNLLMHPFPATLSADEEETVRDEVLRGFRSLPNADQFSIIYLDALDPGGRRILLERNVYSQEYSLAPRKAVVVSEDSGLSAVVNGEDHLRISCVTGGLSLKAAHRRADELDTALEEELHFAASMEWGYLTSSVADLGTGLRASVMMHLPGLAMANLLDKAVKTAAGVGLSVKGFFGEGSGSLGDMYQISNQVTLGMSEEDIVDVVGEFGAKMMEFERRARQDIVDRRKAELEDRVFRALGILKYCRYITAREAIDLLARVRLGIALGMIDGLRIESVTPLLFLCQKSHVQKVIHGKAEADSRMVDHTRAQIVREVLAAA
jgi:protein arginine kinase